MSKDSAEILADLAARAARETEQKMREASRHKPDWAFWKNFARVRIDDALVLAFNIEPSWYGDMRQSSPRDIARFRAIVESYVNTGAIETFDATRHITHDFGNRQVTLREFRRWGESLPHPFTFPNEFPHAGPNTAPADTDMLDARERITLLCIIGALADAAKVDLSQPMKAGDAIAAMMPNIKVAGRTIGEHLKAVRNAMDSRRG